MFHKTPSSAWSCISNLWSRSLLNLERKSNSTSACALESSITNALLEKPFPYKFNLSAFERGDIQTRYTSYATARQWGWLSANDIRELEDLNRIPEGDIYLQPLNMVPAGTVVTPPAPPTPTTGS